MNDLERAREIARVFSRPVMEDIARRGTAVHVVSKLRDLGVELLSKSATVADFFDASLEIIKKSYRCEYIYKEVLASRIVFGRHSPRTASLAVELAVAGSIVDAAVFNGTSTAYEIKTEFDSHRRLQTQTSAYLKAFDRVYLVTHFDRAERLGALLDERVGILTINGKNKLSEIRSAVGNVARIEPGTIFKMLRRVEYMEAVHQYFGLQPTMPNGLINRHYHSLFCQLSSAEAHKVLVTAMRARTSDAESVTFLSALPASLRALAYATPLSRPQRQRVLEALATPI